MELLAEETPTHNLEEEGEKNKIRHWTRVLAVSHTENCGCLKSVSETHCNLRVSRLGSRVERLCLAWSWEIGNICDE